MISKRSYGPFSLQMTEQQVVAHPGAKPVEPDCPCKTAYEFPEGLNIAIDEGNQVCKIAVTKAGAKTVEGVGVGDTFRRFVEVYGPAEMDPLYGPLFERGYFAIYVDRSDADDWVRLPQDTSVIRGIVIGDCGE